MTSYHHDDCIEIISVEVVSTRNAAFTRSASQSIGDDSDDAAMPSIATHEKPNGGSSGVGGGGGGRGGNGVSVSDGSSGKAVKVERYVTTPASGNGRGRKARAARSRSLATKPEHVQDKTLKFVVSAFAFVFIALSFLLVTVTLSMSDHIDDLGTCELHILIRLVGVGVHARVIMLNRVIALKSTIVSVVTFLLLGLLRFYHRLFFVCTYYLCRFNRAYITIINT